MQTKLDYKEGLAFRDKLADRLLLYSRAAPVSIKSIPVPYVYDFESNGYQMILFPNYLLAVGFRSFWKTYRTMKGPTINPELFGMDIFYETLLQKALYVICSKMIRPLGFRQWNSLQPGLTGEVNEDTPDIIQNENWDTAMTTIDCKVFKVIPNEDGGIAAHCAARYEERYCFKWSDSSNEFYYEDVKL